MATKTLEQEKLSPMMQQWHRCKKNAKDALLLFRLGDFYEAFHEDAHTLAKALSLVLTHRQSIPMSGIPAISLEQHLETLVLKKQFVVAIAEQTESAKETKGLVNRAIVRTVSPATYQAAPKEQFFLSALFYQKQTIGLASIDVSTGALFCTECSEASLSSVLQARNIKELIITKGAAKYLKDSLSNTSTKIHKIPDWYFEPHATQRTLTEHWGVHNLDGLGLKDLHYATTALGALFKYATEDLCENLSHVKHVQIEEDTDYLLMDRVTQEHLGVHATGTHTLVQLLDRTRTPMGGRELKQWIARPSCDIHCIQERQNALKALHDTYLVPRTSTLDKMGDLERQAILVQKQRATPRDIWSIAESLRQIPQIIEGFSAIPSPLIQQCVQKLNAHPQLACAIETALVAHPPAKIGTSPLFRTGYSPELDEYIALREDGSAFLCRYQEELRDKYDIKTLKVGYNKVFGYYIEVSKGQANKMPDSFTQKQTLVNANRYISPELKDYEQKILHANDKIYALEHHLFSELCAKILPFVQDLCTTATSVGTLDVLCSLSSVASHYNYVCPTVHTGRALHITQGRHPILEQCTQDVPFVPNDTKLDSETGNMMILTGPNMGGKSTYLRQVALITILTQMGSFVPATSAHIPLTDKIFSRIGAQDDLTRGQSTFMVEMTQTARILREATENSLLLLDEIGRGTSTFDGVSIAWAVGEYIQKTTQAKTLFATHYLELNELEHHITGVYNACVLVEEDNHEIQFLHKIQMGASNESYGIQVAQLAGLPATVITLAKEKLAGLTQHTQTQENPKSHTLYHQINALDLSSTTPLQALQHIERWQHALRSRED